MKKFLKYFLAAAALVYAFVCALVYFVPQKLFYNPTKSMSKLENARYYGYQAEQLEYESADGTKLFAWFTRPEPGRDIIVFMHGNSYNIEAFYHKMIPFKEAGYGTLMPEYRGFGGVDGKITQQNLEADAIAAVNKLWEMGYLHNRIIIYGMSLGSHMAVNTVYELQKRQPFAGLVLEVPFDSLVNVVKDIVPVPMPLSFLMADHYDNLEMIDKIDAPVLIMGGEKDALVPVGLAKNLYEHAKQPKKMIIYSNGEHNNLYNFRNYNDVMLWLEGNEKGIQ